MPYDEAPSRRMAWDADGSVAMFGKADGSDSLTELSAGNRTTLNSEGDAIFQFGGASQPARHVYVLFPELRELDGVFVASPDDDADPGQVASSPDTTNGRDGTWTQQIADLPDDLGSYADFRNEITSMNVATEKGIRIVVGVTSPLNLQQWSALHIYGTISPGETPDRIVFLDTENSDAEFTKVLDFGDVPRGQTTTRDFKIKNNSSSKTINTIQVTAEDLYLNAGGWYTFSDGGAFQATFAVGNLGPGSTKLLTLKQVIPGAETLGLQTGRISVAHDSVT